MIVWASGTSPSDDDDPPGTPWIGWHNIVTAGGITADTEEDNFPATNLANPATHLFWRSVAALGNDSFVKSLLHFNGTDGSTTFTDSNFSAVVHTWTAAGNTQIDTAQSKFGGASGLLDGIVSTPDHTDFTLGASDFTIDFWFFANDAGGSIIAPCGQVDIVGGASTNTAWYIEKLASNVMVFKVVSGISITTVTGTTTFTNAINPGWHHLAAVRTGNVLRLFIDGVQEGGDVAFTATVNDSAGALTIGRPGDVNGEFWIGWIDEFRMSVGVARWTENFTPPDSEYGEIFITVITNYSDDIDYMAVASHNFGTIGSTVSVEGRTGGSPDDWIEIIQPTIITDDTPIIFRFAPLVRTQVRLRIQGGSSAPQAAVVYVGKLLVMERGIVVDSDHVPLTYGRRNTIVNGMSESGHFTGRIKLKEWRESTAVFAHFTPLWYRANFEPFVEQASETPFFYAWHPITYPLETGYAWLTNDPMPETSPVTERVSFEIAMRGVA